jgi:hypothetical protein
MSLKVMSGKTSRGIRSVVRVILEETIDIEIRLRLVSTAKNVQLEISPTSCTICWSSWDETFALLFLYSLGRYPLGRYVCGSGAAGNDDNVDTVRSSSLGVFCIFVRLDPCEASVCSRNALVINREAGFPSKEASGNT